MLIPTDIPPITARAGPEQAVWESSMDQAGQPNDGEHHLALRALIAANIRCATSSDREPGVRRLVSTLLETCRIGVEIFDSLDEMMAGPHGRGPDLVLIDVTVNPSDALEMVERLATSRIFCRGLRF
jgi:hypothetical protein